MRKVFALLILMALCSVVISPSFVQGQNSSRRLTNDAPGQQPASEPRAEAVPDQYFVAFRDGLTADKIDKVKSLGIRVRKHFPEVRAIAIKINNAHQLAALQRNPHVEYIEQEPMRYKMDLSTSQLTPSMSNGLYGMLTTKSTTVHGRNVTGAGINVGVADTSLDYHHPDIAANYKGGVDMVGSGSEPTDYDPINDDGETHGTHVAGTILGVNNRVGVFGVAYNANLYHARVLGPNGGTSSDIMDGVRWLVEQRSCKVINLS
jgi:subtilisin